MQLREDQIDLASKVLARAFHNDPLFIYCFPDTNERKIKSVTHCKYLILIGFLSGEVYTTSKYIESVAIWVKHGLEKVKKINQSKGILRQLRNIRREEFSDPLFIERISTFEEIANSMQNQEVSFPHWYLSMIGVEPIHQGKGYGGKLLRMKFDEIDKETLPCYLHTENERNIEFYKYFGFKLICKIRIPNSDIFYNGMLRDNRKRIRN
jgi:ribosomal protein S18 acetylase RimI-like enzyme